MKRRIKTYYYKDDVDYSYGYVDPLKYHATFKYFLDVFQVGPHRSRGIKALNNPNSYNVKVGRYLNQNTILLASAIISTCIAAVSLYHGINTLNLYHITESGTYVIILVYKIMILSTTRINYEQYQNFIRTMKVDFDYICTNPSAQMYRKKFLDNQLLTWKICIFCVTFTMAIAVFMVSFAISVLVFFVATHEPGDGVKRPLLFPFWFREVDFGASPFYEIAFVYSNVCALAYSYNYVFMIQTQIVWVRHIATKADMVIWCIEDLLVDVHPTRIPEESEHFIRVIKNRIRHIVKQHQSMYSLVDDWIKVYKKLLMYEQKFCASVACLTAYCTAEKLDQGELQLILILLFIATVVLHFIPCCLCTFVTNKTNSICDACWNTPFWNAGTVIRPYFVIMMQRSMRPLPLQVPGFDEISVQTFSSKMANVYSAFNMLRQVNK